MKKGREDTARKSRRSGRPLRGIVIHRGKAPDEKATRPRIAAFIWGGKTRPTPTLPYGRWKGVA